MNRMAHTFPRTARSAHRRSAEYRKMHSELSSYRTEAELADLYAILDRYSFEETAEIRDIIGRNVAAAA